MVFALDYIITIKGKKLREDGKTVTVSEQERSNGGLDRVGENLFPIR